MTGLNLETFLHLLRADWGAWLSLGVVVVLLGLMTWTSWGSRRALRKCLVLSVVVHLGLVLYGSTMPAFLVGHRAREASVAEVESDRGSIQEIRVLPSAEEDAANASADGRPRPRQATWDRPREALALADPETRPTRQEVASPDVARPDQASVPPALEAAAAPEVNPPEPPGPGSRPTPKEADEDKGPVPSDVAPGDPSEIAEVVRARPGEAEAKDQPALPGDDRIRPERVEPVGRPARADTLRTASPPDPLDLPEAPPLEAAPATPDVTAMAPPATRPEPASPAASGLPPLTSAQPDPDPVPASGSTPGPRPRRDAIAMDVPDDASLRDRFRPSGGSPPRRSASGTPRRDESDLSLPDPDIRSRPRAGRPAQGATGAPGVPPRTIEGLGPLALTRAAPAGPTSIPGARGPVGPRPLSEVPPMYRSRLGPNRGEQAKRAGASPESEQAVERALDWLARHQDHDGRWNGGSARTPVAGLEDESRNSFTAHCPPGDICRGECSYAEADTALTGLALLAYLGAGYTHADGPYAATVGKGLRFLLLQQKPDGDLRGPSRAVGMYCHAMATLALTEALALTGDERLRGPAQRAIDFLARAQATDGMSWRYAPRDTSGDTSILGWVVLAFKSAKSMGLDVPPQAHLGALTWLDRVSAGPMGGLAKYQPFKEVTETMTAEAWVCRQLLGTGGPGAASTEAANYLLARGPDRGTYNLYYWYYGTLAMYQHGGPTWTRWNNQVRDQLVRRQRLSGHATGSWDPDDDDQYGARGGRIYSTALATLTLEVYYRYLRVYDEPGATPRLAPTPDPTLRRAGSRPPARPR